MAIAAPAMAAERALLIGVSGYPNFAKEKRLRSPVNDIALMERALRGWGLADASMTILADGHARSTGDPTRSGILAALDRMAEVSAQGDLAVIYLSAMARSRRMRMGTRSMARTRFSCPSMPANPTGARRPFPTPYAMTRSAESSMRCAARV